LLAQGLSVPEGVQDSLGFWIPRRGFRIPGTGFPFLPMEVGFRIVIVSAGDSEFIERYSGFQNPGFQIP